LKKQSQFLKGQNDAKQVMTKVYGDLNEPGRRKNKAKQSQLPNFEDFACRPAWTATAENGRFQ